MRQFLFPVNQQDYIDDIGHQAAVRTELLMQMEREANKQKYPASGYLHKGNVYNGENTEYVNGGLWFRDDNEIYSNAFVYGWHSATNIIRESESDFPIKHIAGVICELYGINNDVWAGECTNVVRLPPNPIGDTTFNKDTGVVTVHGSPAEALEGFVSNGDFRNGSTGWNSINDSIVSVSSRVMSITKQDSYNTILQQPVMQLDSGREYSFKVCVDEDASGAGVLKMRITNDGTQHNLVTSGKKGVFEIRFTASGDGRAYISLLDDGGDIGDTHKVRYISLRETAEEIVLDRYDMWGHELFLEPINENNPWVWDRGNIQSTKADINGIPTVETDKADGYFSTYNGDTSPVRGLGVNFLELSESDKRKIYTDKKQNIVKMNDGTWARWNVRQRSFTGIGNGIWTKFTGSSGQWDSIGVNSESDRFIGYKDHTKWSIRPQGYTDSDNGFMPIGTKGYESSAYGGKNNAKETGVFKAFNCTDRAINSECYFLVGGLVRRRNRGANHPTLNPRGCARYINADSTWDANWAGLSTEKYNSWHPLAEQDCFKTGGHGHYNYGNIGHYKPSGVVGLDRRYDAVYAEDIIDMRMDARGADINDAAELFRSMSVANYRGRDTIKHCRAIPAGGGSRAGDAMLWKMYTNSLSVYLPDAEINGAIGDTIWVYDFDESVPLMRGTITVIYPDGAYDLKVHHDSPYKPALDEQGTGHTVWLIHEKDTDIVNDGKYPLLEVQGRPDKIHDISSFRYGWYGLWCASKQNNVAGDVIHRRDITASAIVHYYYTQNGGTTWSNWTSGTNKWSSRLDDDNNSFGSSKPESEVACMVYNVNALMTEEEDLLPVEYAELGISNSVFFAGRALSTYGGLLGESLLGKPIGGAGADHSTEYLPLKSKTSFSSSGKLWNGNWAGVISHQDINMLKPSTEQSAVKVLWTVVKKNMQLFLQLHARELKWDSGNLSMDGSVRVVTTSDSINGFTQNEVIYVEKNVGGALAGKLIKIYANATANVNHSNWKIVDGKVYYDDFPTVYGTVLKDLGWGDDGHLSIGNGERIGQDLNGNDVKEVCHISTKPIGWIKD